jgi:hypothetical protein
MVCGSGSWAARADESASASRAKTGRPHAQAAEQWLLLPVLAAPLPANLSVSSLTEPFEAELRNDGADVLANPDAARMFETRHSSEPVQLSSEETARLMRSVGQAARHLAVGALPQGQQAMEGIYALSAPARDYLNRDPARARKIFDTCLMTAYLWEREHQSAQALRQMLECSRSFPGFRPEGRAYPPELREVFEHARQQLNQMPATTLLVTSKQGNSCSVRLNGIEMGKSPMSFSEVRAGSMRVQLECDSGTTGRVHSLELKAGENKLAMDPALEAVAHSNGALWLGYASEGDRGHRADADVETIRQVVGATRCVQLLVDGSDYPRVRLRVQNGGTQAVASLSYSPGKGYSHEAVVAAIKALRGGVHAQPSAPLAAAASEPLEFEQGAADADDDSGASAQSADKDAREPSQVDDQSLVPGIVLAVAGVSALSVSWVLYTKRQDVRWAIPADPDGIPLAEVSSYSRSATYILGLAGAGSLLLALSDYFWLPNDPGVPALAWVAGGLGAVITLTGIAFSIWGTHCSPTPFTGEYPRVCEAYSADWPFGPLLAMHGLPFMAIPISYALRAAWRVPGVDVSMRIGTLPAYGNANGLLIEGVF